MDTMSMNTREELNTWGRLWWRFVVHCWSKERKSDKVASGQVQVSIRMQKYSSHGHYGQSKVTIGPSSSYVQMIKVMYDFAHILLICPIRLVYQKENGGLFIVRKSHPIQRAGCILVQCLAGISAFKMLRGMWAHLLNNKGYIVAYFDFMNGIFLHVYFYSLVYFHWFHVDRIQKLVTSLETSPLTQFCTMAPWKAKILSQFFWCLTLYMAAIWLVVIYGFDPRQILVTTEVMARQIFWMEDENQNPPSFLSLLALLARFYHGFCIHLPHNVFGPVYLFCVYFVARDFFDFGVTRNDLTVHQVLKLYKEYRKFLKCGNDILSIFCVHYVGMTMTYHSLHLFDALNTQDHLWKINTYLYILYIVNFLALSTRTLLLGKVMMKKWLWTDQNCQMMSQAQLTLILDHLSSDTNELAVRGGKFFKLSSRFSGLIIQYLCSYSMLNTVAMRRLH